MPLEARFGHPANIVRTFVPGVSWISRKVFQKADIQLAGSTGRNQLLPAEANGIVAPTLTGIYVPKWDCLFPLNEKRRPA